MLNQNLILKNKGEKIMSLFKKKEEKKPETTQAPTTQVPATQAPTPQPQTTKAR